MLLGCAVGNDFSLTQRRNAKGSALTGSQAPAWERAELLVITVVSLAFTARNLAGTLSRGNDIWKNITVFHKWLPRL